MTRILPRFPIPMQLPLSQPLSQLPSSLLSRPSDSHLLGLDQQQPNHANVLTGSTSTSTCCDCNGPNARCISCKCCKEKRACVNCSPGGGRECINIMNVVSSLSSDSEATGPGNVRVLPSLESVKASASNCSMSLSSHGQALMPSPPEACYQAQPIAPSSQPPNRPNSSLPTTVQPPTVNAQRPKKKCMVSDCPVLVAPSMWHQHMSLHASGYYSGGVPNSWLIDQHLFVCSSCHQLVSISRTASHSRCCREQAKSPATLTALSSSSPTEPCNQGLPSFEEVCQLHRPVLRFVPAKARPVFARVISTALRSVLIENSEEACHNVFYLPQKAEGDVSSTLLLMSCANYGQEMTCGTWHKETPFDQTVVVLTPLRSLRSW